MSIDRLLLTALALPVPAALGHRATRWQAIWSWSALRYLFARGPSSGGSGGKIAVRSFNDRLSWTDGIGDVTPTGTGSAGAPIAAANRGTIDLTHCTQIDTSGTSFPSLGTATTPVTAQACGGAPQLPGSVIL